MQTPLRNTRSQKGLRPAVSTETAGNLGIEAAFAHFLQEAQDADAHWYAIKPPCHCKITRQSPLPNEEYLFSLLGLTIAGYNDFLVILGFATLAITTPTQTQQTDDGICQVGVLQQVGTIAPPTWHHWTLL